MINSPPVSVTTGGVSSRVGWKTIVSPLPALAMTWRSEPVSLSLPLTTLYVSPAALARGGMLVSAPSASSSARSKRKWAWRAKGVVEPSTSSVGYGDGGVGGARDGDV